MSKKPSPIALSHPQDFGISTVSCGTCKACCVNTLVLLYPEHGDDTSKYETEDLDGRKRLKVRENGECIYLGERGCTIYKDRPIICQSYDCAQQFASLDRNARRYAIKKGIMTKEIMAAGRKRQGGVYK